MELKSYQKKVIKDLVRYLELMNETKNYAVAFRQFWYEVSVPSLGKLSGYYARCAKPLLQGANRWWQNLYGLQCHPSYL